MLNSQVTLNSKAIILSLQSGLCWQGFILKSVKVQAEGQRNYSIILLNTTTFFTYKNVEL